jgi:hypothetical protein
MKIKGISIDTRYIDGAPSSAWPIKVTVAIADSNPENSWRTLEHVLDPVDAEKVCKIIAGMVVVKPDLSGLNFVDPSPHQIEVWKREKEERDRPQIQHDADTEAMDPDEEEAAHAEAEAEAYGLNTADDDEDNA